MREARMIPADVPSSRRFATVPTGTPWPADAWRSELKRAVTDVDELLALVGVSRQAAGVGDGAGFPLKVPRPYIDRMVPGDAQDPLLRQVLPLAAEDAHRPGFNADPLAEGRAMIGAGVMQKYAGRALVIAAESCAVNCRYCFRRHFPYAEHRQGAAFPALAAVRRDPGIREVILSGGDPLLLTDSHLGRWIAELGTIEHVQRIRLHTRLPVAIPQRVTAALLDALGNARQRVVVVLHYNHGNEVDEDAARAMRALGRFVLLNQSVLLRGVNDDAATLATLSERLFAAGTMPYYLHMPDAVAGTAHFDVPKSRAVALHEALAAQLPGYLVPRLVREVPGAAAKRLIVG